MILILMSFDVRFEILVTNLLLGTTWGSGTPPPTYTHNALFFFLEGVSSIRDFACFFLPPARGSPGTDFGFSTVEECPWSTLGSPIDCGRCVHLPIVFSLRGTTVVLPTFLDSGNFAQQYAD